MARTRSQQVTLRSQDLLLLLAMSARGAPGTYADLAAYTGLAASAVHSAMKRAATCGLVRFQDSQPVVLKAQLREFVLHGAKYVFPAVLGRIARGVPTSYAAPPLDAVIAPSSDPPPVWPHKAGTVRGIAIVPLYPSVPEAALRDEKLYALLALFDALRSGQARERSLAQSMLEKRLQ